MTARQARPTKSRKRANSLILSFLVLLALAGLYGIAGLSRAVTVTASAPVSPAGALSVTSALLACPAPGSGAPTGGSIAEASVPARTGSGHVAITPLHVPRSARPVTTISTSPRPGQLTIKTIHPAPVPPAKKAAMPAMAGGLVPTRLGTGGLIISATGADAQGFDVEQLSPSGQPTARCQPPGSDFWFMGPETTKLHTELYLINPDSVPANASVGVQTDSGPLLGAADSGIIVPPHAMVVQNLGKLVRSAKAAAFHVTTSVGRVVAAVRETDSLAKPGVWLPAAQQPATTQTLTGLPGTTGARELYITVPGPSAARVTIRAVTPRGSYRPTGGTGISLLGHLTTGISLPSLSGLPGSIEISANVPVTAVLDISGGPAGAPGAFISGSAPVTEQGVVAASPAGAAQSTQIVLSAPGKAAAVKVTEAVPGSALTGQPGKVVQIKAKSATIVQLKLPKHAANASLVSVVITPQPGSGPVYAARVAVSGGAVRSVLPIGSSPTRIDLSEVGQSLVRVLGR